MNNEYKAANNIGKTPICTILDLTEKELFNSARNTDETQTQFKARRRTINLATKIYLKGNLSNVKLRLFDYVRVIIDTHKVEY